MRRTSYVVALIQLSFLSANAAVLLVPEQYPNLPEAAAAAGPYDTVSVAAGTYTFGTLSMEIPISLLARSTPASTVIDGFVRYPLSGNYVDTIYLEGFTFIAEDYQLHIDGGLWRASRNAFGTATADPAVQMRRCSGAFENNIFRGHSNGLTIRESASLTLRNNIFMDCPAEAIFTTSDIQIRYNDFFNNGQAVVGDGLDEGNIFHNPLIDDTTFELTAESPCIDAGDPLSPIPDGGGPCIDIGAVEYLAYHLRVELLTPSDDSVLPTLTVMFLWRAPVDTASGEIYDEYRLLLTEIPWGAPPVDTLLLIGDTSLTWPTSLSEGVEYAWRVEAMNDTGGTAYGAVQLFRIAHLPTGAVQIVLEGAVMYAEATFSNAVSNEVGHNLLTGARSSGYQDRLPFA